MWLDQSDSEPGLPSGQRGAISLRYEIEEIREKKIQARRDVVKESTAIS
jgi:hypothetical protein